MIKLKEAIVVEGKYDKIKLENIFDAVIIKTDGFGIFKNKEKLNLIRRFAEKTGIIILTDSDGAGANVRATLNSRIKGAITNVYVPEIKGKERRKQTPSKAGLIGVEGIKDEIIVEAFKKCGVNLDGEPIERADPITAADLLELGLIGGENSSSKRKETLIKLGLPTAVSTKELVRIMNCFYNKKEIIELI